MTRRAPHPAFWVTTSYLAEGIPFAMVVWVTTTMFKDLGYADGAITPLTASIGIAWSLKPFWAAFLDMYRTKKFFVLAMELLMAALFGAIALALRLPSYFPIIIGLLWVVAFASATQDICVDGVYITTLDKKKQAAFTGVQGMAWNVGRIFATFAVVKLVGVLGKGSKTSWMFGWGLSAAVMAVLGLYHYFMLPTGSIAERPKNAAAVARTFAESASAFLKKKAIWGMLLFVFLYRTGEGFLLVEAPLFLQGKLEAGGLGLSLSQKADIDGEVSTIVSVIGGLCGGLFVSKLGLNKRTLVFLAICMNVPHFCYVYLSQAVSPGAPLSLQTIYLLVSIEKFGYSFGFVGNMLYMMQQIAPGKYKMTHYAFCTALMNLVLVPTQMASGPLADWLGYRTFFLFVVVASLPSILAAWLAPFPNKDSDQAEDDEGSAGGPGTKESTAAAA